MSISKIFYKIKSKFVLKTKFIKLLSCGLLKNFEEKLEIYYQAIEGDEDRPVTGNCLEALREGCNTQNIMSAVVKRPNMVP